MCDRGSEYGKGVAHIKVPIKTKSSLTLNSNEGRV
jgi:hypothetical protein